MGEDRIEWDLDGDGQTDLQDNASFSYTFDDPRLHTVNYRLPSLASKFANTWFTFDMRVVESELARCDIKVEEISDRTYRFTPQFDEQVSIGQYKYLITDATLETQVDKIDTNKESATYTFPAGGSYEISMMYFTPQKQKGSCSPMPLVVGFDGNQVAFDLKYRQDSTVPFVTVDDKTQVKRDDNNKEINVSILPAVLEVTITDIFPDATADVAVYYDGKQVFEERPDVYEINIGTL
ncbi:MAG: hypothetical protein H6765_07380 [Candidatus Peribacteria bacterium]|nr:MAG: hypothetical protein H6765_07380 [Candidatus Peribacteria bacterium]